jgi:hypothetical protein
MTFKRDPALPYQKLDEETIVVDPRSREVHLLSPSRVSSASRRR